MLLHVGAGVWLLLLVLQDDCYNMLQYVFLKFEKM